MHALPRRVKCALREGLQECSWRNLQRQKEASDACLIAMFNSSDQLKGLLLIASVVVIWVLASFLVQNVEQAGTRLPADRTSSDRPPPPPGGSS